MVLVVVDRRKSNYDTYGYFPMFGKKCNVCVNMPMNGNVVNMEIGVTAFLVYFDSK